MAGRGNPKTGGRKKGTPNRINGMVKDEILAAFEQLGGAAWLVQTARTRPEVFCSLLGRVLPLQVTGPDDGPIDVKVTLSFK